jgi:hypothetical protein
VTIETLPATAPATCNGCPAVGSLPALKCVTSIELQRIYGVGKRTGEDHAFLGYGVCLCCSYSIHTRETACLLEMDKAGAFSASQQVEQEREGNMILYVLGLLDAEGAKESNNLLFK